MPQPRVEVYEVAVRRGQRRKASDGQRCSVAHFHTWNLESKEELLHKRGDWIGRDENFDDVREWAGGPRDHGQVGEKWKQGTLSCLTPVC